MSGGTSVSVLGLNFASTNQTVTATLSANSCSTASWSTRTLVRCGSAAVKALHSHAVLTVAAVAGTGYSLLTFDGSPHFVPTLFCALALVLQLVQFAYCFFSMITDPTFLLAAGPVVSFGYPNMASSGGGTVTVTGPSYLGTVYRDDRRGPRPSARWRL